MERLTETLPDGRNILKNHYTVIRSNRIGSFIEGEEIDKLAEYEDAEENGLLFRMRFKVGDVVWIKGDEFPAEVLAVSIDGQGLFYEYGGMSDIGNFGEEDIGKTVFLTREEAEKSLEEMGE